jgi:DNA-binding NarL/FixJ family response regulator
MTGTNVISILIVADHAMVRHGLHQLLNSSGDMLVVGQASDGLEALDLCEEFRPDVVLVDIAMSRMEGVRATRMITQRFPHLKVILLSALGDEALSRRTLLVGAHKVVSKDASMDEMLETIRAVYREC